LAGAAAQRLARSGRRVAVAESLTGGLVVEAFARLDGAGGWLAGGIVAYAEDVKRRVLGVTADDVVSAASALQMADGVRRLLNADVAVAITGVGGPDPQGEHPPGSVWIAVDDGREPTCVHHCFDGEPSDVCAAVVDEAVRSLVDRATVRA
jgi:nicotinamide-nucleotide amidase